MMNNPTSETALFEQPVTNELLSNKFVVDKNIIPNSGTEKPEKSQPDLNRVGLYLIEDKIGRGSSAMIYRAHNGTFQYQVALKVLHTSLQDDPDIVRYFVAEVQSGTRLIHPNIVRVYDSGVSDGVACVAQAYVDGITLAQWLRGRGRPFPLHETLKILEDISSALEYAHAQGVIHGNLKPTNIFRDKRGQRLVSDFRVASADAIPLPTNYPTGKTSYLAPEQRGANAPDGAAALTPMSDVFSLALIVLEMLTGQLPYGVDDASIVAPYVHSAMLAKVAVEEPHIRDDLAMILNRALSVDPSHRYPSVESFVQALTGAAQNRLDTLQLSASMAQTPMQTTTALALYQAAPLARITPASRPQMMLPQATMQEQRDMSWIALAVGSMLIALLMFGVMNTMNVMGQRPGVVEAPDPQALDTMLYTSFMTVAGLLKQTQLLQYFSPLYGLGAAVLLLVLLFQRELLRTYGVDPGSRYWRFLGYAIPPTVIAFLLLLVLQIFHMVQDV